MIACGHNNWIKCNPNIAEPFAMEFTPTQVVLPFGFQRAADYTAKLINVRYKNIYLCLSGGIDSEYAATVLLRNEIPFVPVILDADFSRTEVQYAYKFCSSRNIVPHVVDYTGSSGHHRLLKELAAIAYQLKVPMDQGLIPNLVAKLLPDANILTGYGDPISVNTKTAVGNVTEFYDHDYYLHLSGDHPGAFFSYTPELLHAMVRDIDTTKNVQDVKQQLYGIGWRPKAEPFFYELYQTNETQSIVARIKNTQSKDETSKKYFINRDTFLNMLSSGQCGNQPAIQTLKPMLKLT
jgi:hypothetical protein